MAGAQVLPPFPVFTDVDGNPVDDGYIYVGQEGLDPIASPVSVFWDRDLSVPATQPIRTIGGYPSNAGVRSVFYSSAPVYSILVRNKNGTAIYSDSSSLSLTDLESRLADSTDPSKGAGLVAVSIAGPDGVTPSVQDAIKWVTPFMYGVTNDGVTDYTEHLRKMHARANALGVPVKYTGLTSVSVQSNAQIIANTSTDFAYCSLKAINGIEAVPDFTYRKMFIFKDASITPRVISMTPAELFAGAYAFTVPDDLGQGLLHLSSNKPINGRVIGTSDLFFQQVFKVSRRGIVDFALVDDLTANTVVATFYKSPNDIVTIEGLVADETKYNNQTLIQVERNLVHIKDTNILPRVSDIGFKTINALLAFNKCCDVTIDFMASSGQPAVGDGTYGIRADYVANLYVNNVGAQSGWGFMGNNHVNGLFTTNCNINRIEAHEGAINIFVTGGSMRLDGVKYGWGGGIISVRNVEVADTTVISYRGDYGGNFLGDMIVDDVTMNMTGATGNGTTTFDFATIVALNAVGGSLPIQAPRSITVKNVKVRSKSNGLAIRPLFVDPASTRVVTAPINVTIDNVTSNVRCAITHGLSYSSMIAATNRRHTVYLSNLSSDLFNGDSVSTIYDPKSVLLQDAPTAPKPVIHISHCYGVSGYFASLNAEIDISHSSVRGWKSFSGATPLQTITFNDIDVIGTISMGGESQGTLGDGASNIFIYNARVRATSNLSAASAIQGVTIYTGVTCTLGGSVTATTAFSGWKHPTRFVV